MMFKLVNTTSNIKDMKEPFDLEHTMVHIKNYGSNQGIKIMEQIMIYLEKEWTCQEKWTIKVTFY